MTWMRDWGIKQRVLLLSTLPVVSVTSILIGYFAATQSGDLEQSLSDRGFAIVRQLAPALEYGVFSGNEAFLDPLVDAVQHETDVVSVRVRDADGRILAHSGLAIRKTAVDPQSPRTEAGDSEDGSVRVFQTPIRQSEVLVESSLEDDWSFRNPAAKPNTPRILGWVEVEMSRQATRERQRQSLIITLAIGLAVLAIGMGFALRIGRDIANPIAKLRDAVARLEGGDLSISVSTATGSELLGLENGFNAMASALKLSREELEQRIDMATKEVRAALRELEDRNQALDSARRDAESASRAKSAFLAMLSHEIRTPMNGILGFLSLLLKTELGPQQRSYTEKATISTKTLKTLLDDILDYSKLEAGKLALVCGDFDVRMLLDECAFIVAAEANRKSLHLAVVVDAGVPTRLNGPSDRIAQVVRNLLSNAVKFTQAGAVTLRATWSEDATQLVIAVKDTGIGINEGDLGRLFQPFSQLDEGLDRSYGGSGLGLAIVRSLVDLMGGDIAVSSQPRMGSEFRVTMPVNEVPETDMDRACRTLLSGRHALIMTRRQTTEDGIRELLEHWGMIVSCNAHAEPPSSGRDGCDVVVVDDETVAAANLAEEKPEVFTLILTSTEHAPRYMAGDLVAVVRRPLQSDEVVDLLCRKFSGLHERRAVRRPSPVSGLAEAVHLRILVADDNPINRDYLVTWLAGVGMEVAEASNGTNAVAIASSQSFDAILMDVHMPGLDGFEAAARIARAQGHGKPPKLIAITADATEDTVARLGQAPWSGHLIKPVSEDTLLQLVRSLCNQSEDTSEEVEVKHRDSDTGSAPIVDEELGFRLASGNTGLWQRSVCALAERLPHQLRDLMACLSEANTDAACEIGHSISGAAAYCGAIALEKSAKRIEQLARQGAHDELRSAADDLERESKRLVEWTTSRGLRSP